MFSDQWSVFSSKRVVSDQWSVFSVQFFLVVSLFSDQCSVVSVQFFSVFSDSGQCSGFLVISFK